MSIGINTVQDDMALSHIQEEGISFFVVDLCDSSLTAKSYIPSSAQKLHDFVCGLGSDCHWIDLPLFVC